VSIFAKAKIEQAFLKAGLYGFAASGKTVTSSLLLIGTILHCRKLCVPGSEKPAFFIDTEGGSDFMVPVFEHFGIGLYVTKTRAFADMIPACQEAAANGSGLIIDSVTHPWKEFMEAYKRRRKKSFISFEDWDYLKAEWGKFTTEFINSQVHAVLCGRAGFEYEDGVDEDTGKRTISKVGTKMKTEGEMAYEPSLLIELEVEQNINTRASWNTAIVRKDRWMILQSKRFEFVSREDDTLEEKLDRVWSAFSPHVVKLNLGGAHVSVDTSRHSDGGIPITGKPDYKRRAEEKEVVLEKVQNLFVKHGFSGQSKEGKQRVIELLKAHFGTDSWKQIEFHFPLEKCIEGWRALATELDGTDPLAEIPAPPEEDPTLAIPGA
jgi:hypothetical protein